MTSFFVSLVLNSSLTLSAESQMVWNSQSKSWGWSLVWCEGERVIVEGKEGVSDRWGKWSELLSQQSTTRMCTTCAPSVHCPHFLNMHHNQDTRIGCTIPVPVSVCTLFVCPTLYCALFTLACMFVHISYMCTIQTTNGKFSHMCSRHYSGALVKYHWTNCRHLNT